jgi:hypothetical protein
VPTAGDTRDPGAAVAEIDKEHAFVAVRPVRGQPRFLNGRQAAVAQLAAIDEAVHDAADLWAHALLLAQHHKPGRRVVGVLVLGHVRDFEDFAAEPPLRALVVREDDRRQLAEVTDDDRAMGGGASREEQ